MASDFESELVHAIQNGQVYPVFQPIVDIHLHIKGIEVLSRWRKDGVVLLPTEFLALPGILFGYP
jgi:EAL domain-containing protein (putative c-di-GMP-specific phosphodiesterase class I)